MKKLRYLTLSENTINEPIPSHFGKLKNVNVRELQLDYKKFYGNIPMEIGLLSNLEHLWLPVNSLHGTIPTEIGILESLKALVLSDDQVTGQSPLEIGTLSNLEWLWFDSNQWTRNVQSKLKKWNIWFFSILEID